jgi:hypothetical protein
MREHLLGVNDLQLVETARTHLEAWGVDCTIRYEHSPLIRADATLALRWGGARQRFAVYALSSVRLAGVLAAAGESALPVLVVAPWISPRMGAQLQAVGIAYVDAVGNASLRFGTVLIEVSGRARTGLGSGRSAEAGAEARSGRLLTPANRQVIAALLAEPRLESAPLRELAAAAGVSVGQAHKSTTLLAGAGYHRGHLDDAQRESLAGVLQAVAGLEG